MKRTTVLRLAAGLAVVAPCLLLPRVPAAEEQRKHPVYVGVKVCASCHRGEGMGNQYGKWLLSRHSKAHAMLARPEAPRITRLSGIPQKPRDSAVCLGCHATGTEAEDWEKDDTFRGTDGVQCEMCHGPGSEYMPIEVMRNRKAAMAAGLRMPTRNDCRACHQEKGSHTLVLGKAGFDVDKAWGRISHRSPRVQTLPGAPARP